MSDPAAPNSTGPVPPGLSERFRLERLLGRGGFGEVYLATDLKLRRQVALKVLHHKELDAQKRAGLEAEARTVAGLSHPGIVALYELLELPTASVMVMEYVSGQTLAERLESGPPLTLDEAVKLLARVARALAYAHKKGIVHLDLKPSNILLTEDDDPKILDFGLSQLAGGIAPDAERIFGTPHFMAPERIRNDRVSPASDIYAMGIILFLLCTGRLPFEGETRMAIFRAHLEDNPPDARAANPEVRPKLGNVLRRMLEKSPRRRLADAEQLAALLEEAGGGTLSVVEAAEAEKPLPPGEMEMLQYTVATDVLVPGLALPRNVVTEFMLCGSVCRGSALVRLGAYTRERLRMAFQGRVAGTSASTPSAATEEAAAHHVLVGRDASCRLGAAPTRGAAPTAAPKEQPCLLMRLGHAAAERRLLEANVALRVVQTREALIAGCTFDEPPAGINISARAMLKGTVLQEHLDLRHQYGRAPERIELEAGGPSLGHAAAIAVLERLREVMKRELELESLPVRLGTVELILGGMCDFLRNKPESDHDTAAQSWLKEEGEDKWQRLAMSAKAARRDRALKGALRLVSAVTEARAKHPSMAPPSPEPAAAAQPDVPGGIYSEGGGGSPAIEEVKRTVAPKPLTRLQRMGSRWHGTSLSMFPFTAKLPPVQLDLARYPSGDGFPGAYAGLWLDHVLTRGDLLTGLAPWREAWRRLEFATYLMWQFARGLTCMNRALDVTRIEIVDATRLLEFYYIFQNELGTLLEEDTTCRALWQDLAPHEPLAPALGPML